MDPDIVYLGFVPAYLLVLGAVALRYRRDDIQRPKALLLAGSSCCWLSFGLVQLSDGRLIGTDSTLNYALDGLAIAVLVVGL